MRFYDPIWLLADTPTVALRGRKSLLIGLGQKLGFDRLKYFGKYLKERDI